MIVHLVGTSPVAVALEATNTPYPPSFDDNAVLFCWALFSRLLILLLAAATIVRTHARNRDESVPTSHPVFIHRTVLICLMWAFVFGSLGDTITYLFWGETGPRTAQTVLVSARVLDGLTVIPFVASLFVPAWLAMLRANGFIPTPPLMKVGDVIHDLRATWATPRIPIKLVLYSAAASLIATVAKYVVWLEHGLR